MKNKEPYEPDPVDIATKASVFILVLIISMIILGGIFGCYSEKKAVKQVEKALDEYTGPTLAVIRDEYPCVEGDTTINYFLDSTDYIRTRDSALDEAFINKLTLQGMITRLKSFDEAIQSACGDYALVVDLLYDENTKLKESIKKIKPVKEVVEKVVTVEDNLKIFLANTETERYKKLYEADHTWREAREKKDKGNVVVRIPWWLIAILAIATAATAYTRFKTGGFNPVSLFTNKKINV